MSNKRKKYRLSRSKSVVLDRNKVDAMLNQAKKVKKKKEVREDPRGRSFAEAPRKEQFRTPMESRSTLSNQTRGRMDSGPTNHGQSAQQRREKKINKKRSRSVFRLTRQKSMGFLGMFRRKDKKKESEEEKKLKTESFSEEDRGRGRETTSYKENALQRRNKAEETLKRINLLHRSGINDLSFSASKGDVGMMKTLLRLGQDVNQSDENGNTALHYACLSKCALGVKELLKSRELNPDSKNIDGYTPLMIAANNGFVSCVEVLINSGLCDLQIKNNEGKTAFEVSEEIGVINSFNTAMSIENEFFRMVSEKDISGLSEIIEKLNINVRNGDNETALNVAAKRPDNKEIIKLLIDRRILFEKDDVDKSLPEYSQYLKEAYENIRREQVIEELYMTEKAYITDLNLIVHLFIKGANESALRGMIKKLEYLMGVKKMYERIHLVRATSMQFIKRLKQHIPFNGFSQHESIVDCLTSINYGYYSSLIQTQTLLESLIKKKKSFKDFRVFITKQQGLIPFPKIQDFFSILSKPRFRLIKYKDLMVRMMKYTQRKTSLHKKLRTYTKKIMDVLKEIDQKAGEIKNRKNILNVHNLIKSRFKIEALVPITSNNNDKREILQLSEDSPLKDSTTKNWEKRQYVLHETGLSAWDSQGFSLRKYDLFLFSDSILLCDLARKSIEAFHFSDSKVIFDCSKDQLRLRVYKMKELYKTHKDIFFRMGAKGPKWARAIEDAFLVNNGKKSYYYYLSRIRLNNNAIRETYDSDFVRFKGFNNPLKENQAFWIKHFERIVRDRKLHLKDLKKKAKKIDKEMKETEFLEAKTKEVIQMEQPENEEDPASQTKKKENIKKEMKKDKKERKRLDKKEKRRQQKKLHQKLMEEEGHDVLSPLSEEVVEKIEKRQEQVLQQQKPKEEVGTIDQKLKNLSLVEDEINQRIKALEERRKRSKRRKTKKKKEVK